MNKWLFLSALSVLVNTLFAQFTGSPTTIDGATAMLGQFNSLQIVNGKPAISYYEEAKGLKYIRANDADGTSWGTPVVVDNFGYYTSMLVVNGKPCIAYYDNVNKDLKFARANDANGTAWGTPSVVDASSTVGRFSSLQFIKGKPAISYYEIGNGNLRYISANDANGTTWGTPVILDAMGDVGQFTALLMVNGEPAISYYDATHEDLKFIRNEPVVVLPIELTLFKAEAVAQTCLLTWETTQETNTQGFYVQKQTNANANWTDLGFVKAQQKPSIYQFTDENKATKSAQPNTPTYYRLREIRTDGKSSFSKIVSFFSIKTTKK